jgi:anaphase-promoting complex subunit 1
MTEFLLAEIGRRPASDRCKDREGYSLAAGLALGMVTLGRGADGGAIGLADLHIQDRLHRYMVGGKDPDAAAAAAGNDPSKCSRIREGEYVNTEVCRCLLCTDTPRVLITDAVRPIAYK